MTKFTNKFHAKQVYLPWLFAVPFLIFASASSFAQNGSCTVTGGLGGLMLMPLLVAKLFLVQVVVLQLALELLHQQTLQAKGMGYP